MEQNAILGLIDEKADKSYTLVSYSYSATRRGAQRLSLSLLSLESSESSERLAREIPMQDANPSCQIVDLMLARMNDVSCRMCVMKCGDWRYF